MSTRLTNEDYLTYVREHENDIVSGLSNVNLEQFSKKLSQMANISYSVFNALDIENIEPELFIRYMLRIFCEKLNSNLATWESFLNALSSVDGEMTKFADKLKNIDMQKAEVSQKGEESLHDITLSSTDATFLTELLVTASHKWEKIALSLGLKEHEKEGCRAHNDIKMSLYKVINYWLSNHSDTTLIKLVEALSSNLVGETNLSLSIETKIKAKQSAESLKSSEEALPTSRGLTDSQSDPVITDVSKTSTQVAEGKSTLLLVQASPKELVSYQWKKNDTVLEEGSDYSGVHSNMLVVKQACVGVKGDYTCCVKNQEKEVHSENITLDIVYPLGKKKLLHAYFTPKEIFSEDSWPPVVSKEFISLALITSSEDSKYCSDITVRGDQDDIMAQKEEVKYEEVFGAYKSRELIMIEGRPGSGKTTLVHKIIKDWASGTILMGAKLVFLVVLREVTFKEAKSLPDLLKLFYLDDEELQAVQKFIFDSDGERLVFVLDGLDEYNSQDKKNDVIIQLLDKKLLPLAMIIVSSRPSASKSLKEHVVSKRIEIVGFSEKEIMEYIDHFPFSSASLKSGQIRSSKSVQDSLKKYLHSHPHVMDMCYLPVHTAMICYLYADECLSPLSTQTNIYEQFTLSIIVRQVRKKNPRKELDSLRDLKGEFQDFFNAICKLAYYMVKHSDQIVTSEDIKCYLGHNEGFHGSNCLGLITIYNQTKKTSKTKMFSFLHLTLQEFLAAYYISCQSSSKQLKIYKEYSVSNCMETVWNFYCGLVSFQRGTKQFKGVFDSKKAKSFWSSKTKLIQYAFESQNKVVCDKVTKNLNGNFQFWGVLLTPSDLLAIGYVICKTTLPVNKICIGELQCGDNRINILLKKICEKSLNQLETITIKTQITADGIESIIHTLESSRGLEYLDISLKNVSDEESKRLAHNLSNLHQLVYITLTLSSSPSSIEAFIESLPSFSFSNRFWFTFEDITKEGVQALARGLTVCSDIYIRELKFVNTSVKDQEESPDSSSELDTSCQAINTIGCEGAAYLSSSLQYLSQLRILSLSHNDIGPEGITCLSSSMKYLTHLKDLDLSHNNIGSEGVVTLSSSFQYLNKLSKLDLSHNNICSEGAISLSGSLKYLTHLWELDLSHNNIGSAGIRDLAHELSHLTNLSYFYIAYNNIDLEGALLLLTNLKECHKLSAAVINTTEEDYELRHIVVQDIVKPDDDKAIEELKEAARNKKEERKLKLGFTTFDIPPAKSTRWKRLKFF